jgi:hypothetical protein
MATDYGTDLYCDTDMDASMTEVSGSLLMQQVILRRLYTPKGSLLSAPGENTVDLREWLSSSVDPTQREITGAKAAAMSALMADPRIESVTITPRFDATTRTLLMSIAGYGALGPFSLTIGVTSLTVDILNGQ